MEFLADVRKKVWPAVVTSYGFHTSAKSIRDNAARARQLLSNGAFICRVGPNALHFRCLDAYMLTGTQF